MIREAIIITTDGENGAPHLAPMGIAVDGERLMIAVYRPARTLDNLIKASCAVINYTDDVRVFAGCLTGRHDWPIKPAAVVQGAVLSGALAHAEVEVEEFHDDSLRPRFICRIVHEETHAPFRGFNRAKAAVVEAAILASRVHMMPAEQIGREIAQLLPAVDKTAGPEEREAWDWLMEHINAHHLQSRREVSP